MLKACLQSFPVLHIGNSFQQHFSVALAYAVACRNRDDACPFAYTVPFSIAAGTPRSSNASYTLLARRLERSVL